MQEVAFCSKCRRTASVKSKNYCVTARLKKNDFSEIVERFPDFYEKLKQHARTYQDDLKKQLRAAIRCTNYTADLPDELVEEMIYTLRQE